MGIITICVDHKYPDERVQSLKDWLATLEYSGSFTEYDFKVIRDEGTWMDHPPTANYDFIRLFRSITSLLESNEQTNEDYLDQ